MLKEAQVRMLDRRKAHAGPPLAILDQEAKAPLQLKIQGPRGAGVEGDFGVHGPQSLL